MPGEQSGGTKQKTFYGRVQARGSVAEGTLFKGFRAEYAWLPRQFHLVTAALESHRWRGPLDSVMYMHYDSQHESSQYQCHNSHHSRNQS
jgi:hypothetical protein